MRPDIRKLTYLLILLMLHACSSKNNSGTTEDLRVKSDTITLIHNFIYGLWSVSDNQYMLNNAGFYFQPDGKVRLVASEMSGNWELIGYDSLKLSFVFFNHREEQYNYKIDSLELGRMVLSSDDETTVYRKVPFGVNQEGTIIKGIVGSLQQGVSREYFFDLISAKELSIELKSESKSIGFDLFDDTRKLSSIGLKNWKGIVTHGGQYKILVGDTIALGNGGSPEFDIKVIGF